MTPTNTSEPVRIRGWAAVIVSAVVAAAVAFLSGADPQGAVLTAILTAVPMVGGIEWQRSGAWSPTSVQKVTTAAAQLGGSGRDIPYPDDLLRHVDEGTVHVYTYPGDDR